MKILVLNPNTTTSMTATIAHAAVAAAAPGTTIVAETAPMGPVSIEGYYDEAFAVPGVVAAIGMAERQGASAAVIACFDDTGLDAARSFAGIPIVGICEAGLVTASQLARRFSVVTTLERSIVPIEDLVHKYGFGARCTVRACNVPVLALEDPASNACSKLEVEIARAITDDRAEAIVLGCAGMADLARRLSATFGLPVVDGVSAAVKQAEALVSLGLTTSKIRTYAAPGPKSYLGPMAPFEPAA